MISKNYYLIISSKTLGTYLRVLLEKPEHYHFRLKPVPAERHCEICRCHTWEKSTEMVLSQQPSSGTGTEVFLFGAQSQHTSSNLNRSAPHTIHRRADQNPITPPLSAVVTYRAESTEISCSQAEFTLPATKTKQFLVN